MNTKNKKQNYKRKIAALTATTLTMLMNVNTYATSTIGQAEVQTATNNIKNAVVKIATPIGSVLMFVSIVIIAIKLIVNANNPNKRAEGIGGLAWVALGFMLLSLALIVSGILLSVATNGSGAMIGSGG